MDMLYGLQMISPVVCKCPFLAHSACKDAEFRRHYEHVAANSGSPWASIKGKVAMLHTVVDATIRVAEWSSDKGSSVWYDYSFTTGIGTG